MAFVKSTQMHHFNSKECYNIPVDEMEIFRKGWHNTFSTLMGREVSTFATFIASTLKASINTELLITTSGHGFDGKIELYPILMAKYTALPNNGLFVRQAFTPRCILIGTDGRSNRYIGYLDVEGTLEFVRTKGNNYGEVDYYVGVEEYMESVSKNIPLSSFQRVTVEDIDGINNSYFAMNLDKSYILPF